MDTYAILLFMFAAVPSGTAQQSPQPKPDINALLVQLQSKTPVKGLVLTINWNLISQHYKMQGLRLPS
jgi:hypothetical protein